MEQPFVRYLVIKFTHLTNSALTITKVSFFFNTELILLNHTFLSYSEFQPLLTFFGLETVLALILL